jgi:thiol-disulfide isomerase/thioredoxin
VRLFFLMFIFPVWAYGFEPTATLSIFFRSDCPPCMQEFAIIPDIAKAHSTLHIRIIALDNKPITSTLPDNIEVLQGNKNDKEYLKKLGNTHFALPFSTFINKNGNLCDTHYGILGTELVNTWMHTC